MTRTQPKGTLWVRYGPMGGEKTTWLISQYIPKETLIFIPDMDWRSGKALKTHNGLSHSDQVFTINVNQPEQIEEIAQRLNEEISITRILIDETNFFTDKLVPEVQKLLQIGLDIYATGLLLDSDLKDFGPTRKLAHLAKKAEEVYARCDFTNGELCKNKATFNYFKKGYKQQVAVGAWDMYGATCAKHLKHFRTNYQASPLDKSIKIDEVWKI
jgi:thymidine kinase